MVKFPSSSSRRLLSRLLDVAILGKLRCYTKGISSPLHRLSLINYVVVVVVNVVVLRRVKREKERKKERARACVCGALFGLRFARLNPQQYRNRKRM